MESGDGLARVKEPQALLEGFLEGQPRRIVLRDRVMWKALWEELHSDNAPPLPEVDFTTEMLVVVANGNTSGSERIKVEAASLDATALTVAVRTRRGGCDAMPSVGAPVHVVRLPRSDVPVVFQERHLVIGCSGTVAY